MQGTGLGLAEVYGIVKRHRGQAQIESMPGVGTTIRLIFPQPGAMLAADAAESADAQPERVARRVLLVEDHPDSREFMRKLLEDDGHTVDSAENVEIARSLLEREYQPFDVLVTDIGLPDGSGWDLIAFARQRWPALRIGVVTGWEPRAGAGADGDFILRKPVKVTELLRQVGLPT